MHTTAAILDIHDRTHRSIRGVLDHLATLPPHAMTASREGFSYPTLATQIHHVLGAERYWMGVLKGDICLDDDAAEHATVETLRALEASVREDTRAYLSGLSDEDMATARTVTKWNGDTAEVVPAHVVLRTQTHAYQHQGEIATLLRQLGHSFPSLLDFPLG